MQLKLYRHDNEDGPSLGGGWYPGGTDFYLTNDKKRELFFKRPVDEEWWVDQESTREIPMSSVFVKNIDSSEIGRVKWKDNYGTLRKENFEDYNDFKNTSESDMKKQECSNAIDMLEI